MYCIAGFLCVDLIFCACAKIKSVINNYFNRKHMCFISRAHKLISIVLSKAKIKSSKITDYTVYCIINLSTKVIVPKISMYCLLTL